MNQTVMELGHWHVFLVTNNVHISTSWHEKCDTNYEYIASANPHDGRPQRDLLRDVVSDSIYTALMNEWISVMSRIEQLFLFRILKFVGILRSWNLISFDKV